MKGFIGYIRVSRINGRGGDTFISPEVQRKTIEGLAASKGIEISEWVEELDRSGKRGAKRPDFDRAIELVESGECAGIVVAKLTRFARSVLDTHRAIERMEAGGGSLIAADLDIDPKSPTGKLMRTMLAALAEFELDIITEKWLEARVEAVDRGIYIAHTPPLGYRFDKEHRLVPDPRTKDALRALFLARADGTPYQALVEQWRELTGQEIAVGSLNRVISNRAYLGEVRSGPLVNDEAHEPLLTPAEWTAAQAVSTQRGRRTETSTALLGAATLRCGSCGRTMSFRGGKEGQYCCNRQSKGETCPGPVLIDGKKLDSYVEAELLKLLARAEGEGPRDESRLASAEDMLAAAIAERDAFIASVSAASIGADAFRTGAEQRALAVAEAEMEIKTLHQAERLENVYADGVAVWERADLDERRQLIAAAFETITIHPADRSRGRWQPVEERVAIVETGSARHDPARAAA
jgi:site-specific DNA recombinase